MGRIIISSMGFQIKIHSEEMGITFLSLDDEICRLWHVEPSDDNWAVPPNRQGAVNSWREFVGQLIYASVERSGKVMPSQLLEFYLDHGATDGTTFIEYVENDIYYISLLLYLISRKIWFSVEYMI